MRQKRLAWTIFASLSEHGLRRRVASDRRHVSRVLVIRVLSNRAKRVIRRTSEEKGPLMNADGNPGAAGHAAGERQKMTGSGTTCKIHGAGPAVAVRLNANCKADCFIIFTWIRRMLSIPH